jgi:endoglucanase
MADIKTFLKELISAPGISGYESAVRPRIESAWEGLTDSLSVSKLGSLHGLQRGTAPEPRPSILLAAHMDAIGLMVNGILDGLIHACYPGNSSPCTQSKTCRGSSFPRRRACCPPACRIKPCPWNTCWWM